MANLLALDWDSHELRAIAARSSGTSVTVQEVATVRLDDESPATITEAIRRVMDTLGVPKAKAKALVTLGRSKSELRQLTLPPVPENELPDMVRLQAMQTFAAVGDNAHIDFLPLPGGDDSTSVIAAAVTPATMKSVQTIVSDAGLELSRVALRPVAAAALYQLQGVKNQSPDDSSIVGDVVMVDLLPEDAEIVVLRGRRVMFVRSVRMPAESADRPTQIAGELRRSLMACGINASSTSQKVIIWGQAAVHEAERLKLAESLGCRVTTIDPMTLVDLDRRRGSAEPVHTGRFAPLLGLLVADAKASLPQGSPYLVDFLNPRKAVEVKKDHRKPLLIGGAVAAAIMLMGYGAWSSLNARDREIQTLEAELAALKPDVARAEESIQRTETVDKFLDGNVVWLDELSRIAQKMPPAETAIVKSVSAVAPPREGGGRLTLQGATTSPAGVDQLSSSLRDTTHSVSGSGAGDLGPEETYRWSFRETVAIEPTAVREKRYSVFAALREQESAPESAAAVPTQSEEPVKQVEPVAATGSDQPETKNESEGGAE